MIAGFAYDNGLGSLGLTPVQESRRLAAQQKQAAALAKRQGAAAARQQAAASRQAANRYAAAQRQAAAQSRQAAAKTKAAVRKQEAQTKQATRKAEAQAKKAARIAKKVGGKTVQATPEDAKKLDQLTAKRDELKKKIADAKAALALKRANKKKRPAGDKTTSASTGMGDVDEFGNEIGDAETGSITPIDQPTKNTGSTATSIPPTSILGGPSSEILALMQPKNMQQRIARGRLNAKDMQYLFMKLSIETQQQTQELLQEILSLNQQLMELLSQLAIVDDSTSTTDVSTGTTQLLPPGTIFMDESGNMVQGDIQPLQNQTYFQQPFQQAPSYAPQSYMPTVDDRGGYGITPTAQQPQSFNQPLPTASFQPQYDEFMPTLEDQGSGDISSYFSQGSMIVGAGGNLPVVNDAPERGYEEAGASGEDVSLDSLVSGDGDIAEFSNDWMGLDYGDMG